VYTGLRPHNTKTNAPQSRSLEERGEKKTNFSVSSSFHFPEVRIGLGSLEEGKRRRGGRKMLGIVCV
jgi:hypothetical protein